MNANSGSHADCRCHFHPDLIVVRRENVGDALEFLIQNVDAGAVELNETELLGYIDALNDDEIGAIVEMIALLRVTDPHVSAQRVLDEVGVEASPIHGLGFMGHGGFKGDEFVEVPVPHPAVAPSAGDLVIAVVDSGIAVDEELPAWLSHPSVLFDRPQDTEVPTPAYPVSHGTFVASVIRRIAPTHTVSIASARPDPGYMVTDEEPHLPSEAQPTDELNVFGALVRLVNRHSGSDNIVALNLALGAHECPGGGSFLLAMRIALDYWRSNFDWVEIFAAGGNSTCEAPMYPAAWDDVRAVGAAEDGGRQVVWVKGNPVTDPGRDWITDWAPGQEILGLSGQNPDQVIEWSGSSFACAIVTACYANNAASTLDANGQTWWPDQNMDYSSIPDLEI